MNKILIELYVPVLNANYDVYVSATSSISDLEKMLVVAVEDLCKRKCVSSAARLYDFKSGKVFDKSKYVYEYKIGNGDKLMLI